MTPTKIIFVIISCLLFSVSADASGFIFKWDVFLVNRDLFLNNKDKKVYINDLSEIEKAKFALHKDQFDSSVSQNGLSRPEKEKKSFLENLKISISPIDSAVKNKNDIYYGDDGEQISNFIDAFTSLIYDDSKSKSLETIGKIIEPQINLYFEF